MLEKRPRVGVVGNCVAGKSTLVDSLKELGYDAVNIPQEHSVSPRFWRRLKPDYLIYLSCTLDVAKTRRKFSWGQERLDQQWQILSDAREHADLCIDTDCLSKADVLKFVLTQINAEQQPQGEGKEQV